MATSWASRREAASRSEGVGLAGRARIPLDAGDASPGAIYDIPSGVSPHQVSSTKRGAAVASFSRSNRWAAHEKQLKSNTVPGPGHYG